MEMSERNFSYICRIGECEREKLVARIAALEIERNNELEGNARFRVEHEHRVRLLYARIAALEGDADMVDEREMRSNLRIEALEAAGRQLATAIKAVQPEMRREHDAGDGHFSTDEVDAVETALAAWRTAAKGDRGE